MTTSKPILASESNESSRVRFSAVLALCSAVRHSVLTVVGDDDPDELSGDNVVKIFFQAQNLAHDLPTT